MKGKARFSAVPVLLLTLIVFLAGSAKAADTGTIIGSIVDSETGEAVINANVVVLESQPKKGAATDFDGNFVILQVASGLYEVEISSVGYHTIKITEVAVVMNTKARLGKIKLTPSAMELEELIVVADKKAIRIEKPNQTITKSSEDIEKMAVQNVTDIIKSMPGFKVDDEGAIHARGGRPEETKYVINGIDSRDPLVGGQSYVNLDVDVIEQLDVLSGGFGPEYGQAQAAIIKVATKEGKKDKYTGRIEWETDQPIDAFSFNSDQLVVSYGGPLPFQKNRQKVDRATFYFSSRAYLTDTHLPFDVERGSWDYVNLGIDLPERQKNEYSASLKLAFPIGAKSKLVLYGDRFYRRWDLYPEGEGPTSGNYGYPYIHNVRNRPRAETNKSSFSLTYNIAINETSTLETTLYRANTTTLLTPGNNTPDDFTLEYASQEATPEDSKSAFEGYQDRDGNGYFDGYVDANNNGQYDGFYYDAQGNPVYSEGYEDLNRNGLWDPGEDWIDVNGNGLYDAAEPYYNLANPVSGEDNAWYDPWDNYEDLNGNGRWDDAEPQTPEQDLNHNGTWDGERYIDANNDGIWNGYREDWVDANGNGSWDAGEEFTDSNGNGFYDHAEGYDDWGGYVDADGNDRPDGRMNFTDVRSVNEDLGEPYLDGDLFFDTGEPFIDRPDPLTGLYNGVYDTGEQFLDLPTTDGRYLRWLQRGAEGTMPLPSRNGSYDPPNFTFDEYELFTRHADFIVDPFASFHSDPNHLEIRGVTSAPSELLDGGHYAGTVNDLSYPVIYVYDPEWTQRDWPVGHDLYKPMSESTWTNRSDDPELMDSYIFGGEYFMPPNYSWEDYEPFVDYNSNGIQDGASNENSPFIAGWGQQYNQEGYFDFFLNPETFDQQAIWQERLATTYSWKTEYQVQANKYHDMLTGFELIYREMEMQSIEEPQVPYDGLTPLPPKSPYPGRGETRDFYSRKPFEGAVYLRDRMEFEGLNVLIGLRYDFLLHEKSFISETEDEANNNDPGAIAANTGTGRFSPRLGISHPITETAKLYFNYGHFYQAPSYQYFYRETTGSRANSIIVGNPNLKYQKTVEYQFGVEARFEEIGTTVNIQGYYRDIFDQITSTSIVTDAGYTIDQYTNGDYGRARGVNFSVEKANRHTGLSLNYEMSFAYGKASSAREAAEDRIANRAVNREEHPLGWDQTHSINAYWSIFYGPGDHPQLFGYNLPSDWLISVDSSYGSGRPYTPSLYTVGVNSSAKVEINSYRMPWSEITNFKFEKYFRLGKEGKQRLITGFEIRNLFSRRNWNTIYSATGNIWQQTHAKDTDYVIYYPNKADYDANPRNYSAGRHVSFKIGYNF
jgi:outer membrane receptor protein involved in Fe transport